MGCFLCPLNYQKYVIDWNIISDWQPDTINYKLYDIIITVKK